MKKLRTKILFSFLIVLLLLAGMGTLSYINLHRTNEHVNSMVSNDLRMLVANENMMTNISERISNIRAFALYQRGSYRLEYQELSVQSAEIKKELIEAGKKTGQTKKINNLIEEINEWSQFIEESVIPAILTANSADALNKLSQAETRAVQIMYQLKQLSKENEEHIQELGDSIIREGDRLELILSITGIVAILLGVVIAIFTARKISKPILQVANRLEKVAKGDLTGDALKTKSKDELGSLVASTNEMVKSLKQMVAHMNQSSEQIAASSQELTASAEQTSNATEQIAASSEQMASSTETQLKIVSEAAETINQISAGIQQIAANSESVSVLAGDASKACDDGVGTVNEVVDQMHTIENTVKETSTIIKTLGERSNEIGKIVTMITDISDQTSLLALNAAIEAARAGEAGRGFAVVADEVRKLAEQTAQSATQITELIRTIQEETAIAVQSMEVGTEKTAEGLEKTNQLSAVFQKIDKAVRDVEAKVQEVSAAAEQIATGSEQMVSGIQIVKEAAQNNAQASQENAAASEEQLAMMEEISSSAQALAKLADEMADLVRKFKV